MLAATSHNLFSRRSPNIYSNKKHAVWSERLLGSGEVPEEMRRRTLRRRRGLNLVKENQRAEGGFRFEKLPKEEGKQGG